MSQPFDPYLKWLGIAPKDQPPNHYRLLGINPFTDDPEVIENSADREMAHVRTFQTGRHAELSQKLLNEISAAKVCLLDPQKKVAYDRALKAKLAPAKKLATAKPLAAGKSKTAKPAQPKSPQTAASAGEFLSDAAVNFAAPAKRLSRPNRRSAAPIIATAVGVLLVAAVVIYAISRSNDRPEVAARADPGPAAMPPADEGRIESPADDPSLQDTDAKGNPPSDDVDATAPAPPQPNTNDANDENPVVEPKDSVVTPTPDETPDEPPGDVATSIDESPTKTDARREVPAGPALTNAIATVREVFQSDADAAVTPEQKSALARKIIEAGVQTPNDAAVQFMLFRVGRDLAVSAGDVTTAIEAVEKTAASFQIDATAVKTDTLLKVATQLRDAEQFKAFAAAARRLTVAAMAADDLDLALKLADARLTAARRTGEIELIKYAVTEKRSIESSAARFRAVERALAVLQNNPDDADANLTVGKHRCFVNGDWPAGLALLAKGGDEALKALATEDLNFSGDDAEGRRRVALGDRWWDLAQDADEDESPAMLRRSAHWYQRALADLSGGLVRVKVEERLARIGRTGSAVGDTGRDGATKIVVWNAHNSIHNNYGTNEFNISVLSKGEIVWKQDKVQLPWKTLNDPNVAFDLPRLEFDKVRVEVTKFRSGGGGALSEIQVFHHGRNIARHGRATASAEYGRCFDAGRINDGVTHSNRDKDGYWVLPRGQLGWIEIDLSQPAALLSGQPADARKPATLVIWNTNNGRFGDRGTTQCNIFLLSENRPVWSQKGVKLPFFEREVRPLAFELPREKFDAVRVEVTSFHRGGGGLSEIEVLRNGINIARFARASASARFGEPYGATKINDGIRDSAVHGLGYWLLPDNRPGWIELDLSGRSAGRGSPDSANPPPLGEWTELLPLVDVDRHAIHGTWNRNGDQIISGGERGQCRAVVPVTADGDYDLEVAFKHAKGSGYTTLFLPVRASRCMLVLSETSGLEHINATRWNENETTREFSIQEGRQYTVAAKVRTVGANAAIAIEINGRPFITWQGPASALSVRGAWNMPPTPTFGFGSDSVFDQFQSFRLRVLTGEARLVE